VEEKILTAGQAWFQSEMTIDKAYVRRTWKPLGKLRRTRWLIALLPLICLLYSGYVMLAEGDLPLGIPIMSGIFLLFALLLPGMAVSHMFGQYRQFHADGKRRISLFPDYVETELLKYGNTVTHRYEQFDHVEEDGDYWYLVMASGQKVMVPKAPCLLGDSAGVKELLTQRIAACAAAALEAEERGAQEAEEAEECELLPGEED